MEYYDKGSLFCLQNNLISIKEKKFYLDLSWYGQPSNINLRIVKNSYHYLIFQNGILIMLMI